MARPSRRRVLGVAGAAALASTAGCLRRLQDAATTVEFPDPGPPTYRRWLPAPGALPGEDRYSASHLRMADLLGDGPVGRAGVGLRNLFARTGRDPLGVDPGDVEAVVKIDLARATTLLGTFDPEAVGAAVERAGYAGAGADGEFEVYERDDRPRAVAVGESAVVQTHSNEDPTAVLGAVLDAGRGEVDRYHEVDERFARLSRAAGGATLAWVHPDGGLGAPESAVGSASAQQFDGETAVFRQLYLFEEAADASVSAVRDAAAGAFPPEASTDASVDGRMGRFDAARAAGESVDEPVVLQPVVAWGFDAGDGGVTVTHRAGDEVDATRLTLRQPSGPTDAQFADRHETVGPGDAVTVAVDATTRLRVVWSAGDSTATLSVYRGPDDG